MPRTATAAPSPADRPSKPASRPHASRVRTARVSPEILQNADLGAPIGALPAELAAALAAAQQVATARRANAKKASPARIRVTAHEAAALAAAGWKPPHVTADNQWKPQPRGRMNACKGDATYGAALSILSQRPLNITELAALWIAAGNTPRQMAGICQQLANRAKRVIRQEAGTLTLS